MDLNSIAKFFEHVIILPESILPRTREFNIDIPFMVQRADPDLFYLYAEYFYSLPDSIVRFVSYNWENNRYATPSDKNMGVKMKRENGAEYTKKYNEKYELLKTKLIEQFGQPIQQDDKPLKATSVYDPVHLTVWDADEKIIKLDMLFKESTNNIRLYYYWK